MKPIKYLFIAAILFPFLFLVGGANATQQPEGLNGKADFKLEQYRGKVVLLDFWASWCGPCREAFPWLNEMHRKYQGLGLEIIAVNLDEVRSKADQFLIDSPANFSIQYDPEGVLAKDYDLQGMPYSLLFDRNGKLLNKHVGFFKSKAPERELEIRQALKNNI
ncbi:MAG: TlpA disulfide reductase family protein [Candidatus Thiodiazotropha sp.]